MQSFAKYGMHRMLAAGAGVALGGAAIAASDPALCEKNLSATGGFDPEALERGAKALREMNNSPHAKKVLELSKTQEETRKQELKTEEAKYHAHMAQQAKEVEQVKWDEQRKTMQQQAQTKAQLAKYEDELARARQQAEHEAARARNAETVKMQEDATARSENLRRMTEERIQAERRSTDKERAELEKEVGRAKALAEAEGRVLEGRQNEDVNRRALLLRLEEERKKAVEVVNTAFGHLGRGAYELVTDRNKMVALAGGMTAMAAGVYGAREGTRVAGRAIDRWLRTPSLWGESTSHNLAIPSDDPSSPSFTPLLAH